MKVSLWHKKKFTRKKTNGETKLNFDKKNAAFQQLIGKHFVQKCNLADWRARDWANWTRFSFLIRNKDKIKLELRYSHFKAMLELHRIQTIANMARSFSNRIHIFHCTPKKLFFVRIRSHCMHRCRRTKSNKDKQKQQRLIFATNDQWPIT